MDNVAFDTYYIALYDDGSPVGLDIHSGGYPFKANHPSQIRFWINEECVRDYLRHRFDGVNRIAKVRINIEDSYGRT